TAEPEVVELVFRNDEKLRQVDGVGTLTQDGALRTTLATRGQKATDVLKIGLWGVRCKGLRRAEWPAVSGEDVSDASLRDRHERHLVHAILQGHEIVQAATKDLRLKASLAAERDETALHRATEAEA